MQHLEIGISTLIFKAALVYFWPLEGRINPQVDKTIALT